MHIDNTYDMSFAVNIKGKGKGAIPLLRHRQGAHFRFYLFNMKIVQSTQLKTKRNDRKTGNKIQTIKQSINIQDEYQFQYPTVVSHLAVVVGLCTDDPKDF